MLISEEYLNIFLLTNPMPLILKKNGFVKEGEFQREYFLTYEKLSGLFS